MSKTFWRRAGFAAALAAGGCAAPPADRSAPPPAEPAAPPVKPAPAPAAGGNLPLFVDECSGRLHDLSGLLLHYYLLNRSLPDRLEDLGPLADFDAEADFTCPASGRPYAYAPDGLAAPGKSRLLVVYDPTPAHNGVHWGIAVSPPLPGQPPATFVVPLSPADLAAYQPAGGDVDPAVPEAR